MKRSLYLLVVAVVAVAATWAGWHWLPSGKRPARLALPDLTPELRARIDRIAAASPLETVQQEQVNFAGDVTVWLIGQALPSPEEEASHAAGVREQLLAKYRTV